MRFRLLDPDFGKEIVFKQIKNGYTDIPEIFTQYKPIFMIFDILKNTYLTVTLDGGAAH